MKRANAQKCEKESLIIKVARRGLCDKELEQHAANCPVCSEVAFAARVLNEMRAEDEAQARIPDAGLMWWKAQLLAKREAGEKATQPINFAERFAYAWAAICLMGICVWQWDAIRAWFASIPSGRVAAGLQSVANLFAHIAQIVNPNTLGKSASTGSLLAVIAGGSVLLLILFFAMYFSQSEE